MYLLTPCVYRRGWVWLLFALAALLLQPFDTAPEPPASPPAQQSQG